eukprot:TRINITY_DN39368_c0_g1_i2.p1 TRINITY_DN39368_c0_g1~~TRINITY_DN39368_c0_g1_i2.p1  ORF type:complete len:237 (-),score=53.04 TRINITY_DN39368_c0_g1_i2:58-711(-)
MATAATAASAPPAPAASEVVSERYALVLCDLQLASIRQLLGGARDSNWCVVWTGLRFPKSYEGVSSRHRLYGGFKRLNEKMGDDKCHWFMEGWADAELTSEVERLESDQVVWRQNHLPSDELIEVLRSRKVTKVVVAGLKLSYSVQATVQRLCDENMLVYVVKECVADDKPERQEAILEHILPVYADCVEWASFQEGIAQEMLMDRYVEIQHQKRAG